MLALTLPKDLDARLEGLARVTGQSKAALVEEAVLALVEDLENSEREKASLETWLRTEGVAAHDRLKADPGRALSIDQVRAHLERRRG
ncbi:putative transcriptional regulator [Peteryoungia aggregata LMG 23059]|uniref:Transcriptional regulator n=1 Tax=Peteryoungia aggregata LMG 23059 TaxID=1368425 RepID=A0ABU0GDD2_9HYPH|nr:ribbon-helix-helix protein, CopG family [Peteryoungia aggregata]MDQ0423364.1 putative transcriptional regulator [Peteryoungia aggregata LMG 23059]